MPQGVHTRTRHLLGSRVVVRVTGRRRDRDPDDLVGVGRVQRQVPAGAGSITACDAPMPWPPPLPTASRSSFTAAASTKPRTSTKPSAIGHGAAPGDCGDRAVAELHRGAVALQARHRLLARWLEVAAAPDVGARRRARSRRRAAGRGARRGRSKTSPSAASSTSPLASTCSCTSVDRTSRRRARPRRRRSSVTGNAAPSRARGWIGASTEVASDARSIHDRDHGLVVAVGQPDLVPRARRSPATTLRACPRCPSRAAVATRSGAVARSGGGDAASASRRRAILRDAGGARNRVVGASRRTASARRSAGCATTGSGAWLSARPGRQTHGAATRRAPRRRRTRGEPSIASHARSSRHALIAHEARRPDRSPPYNEIEARRAATRRRATAVSPTALAGGRLVHPGLRLGRTPPRQATRRAAGSLAASCTSHATAANGRTAQGVTHHTPQLRRSHGLVTRPIPRGRFLQLLRPWVTDRSP
jgi:hypothetical protein